MEPTRRLWTLIEPFHAVLYYAPEPAATFEAIGLRGFWRGYFAARAAPLGPVGPGVVTACFFGFRPDFVARAVPSIWSIAAPERVLEARLVGVDAALRGRLDVDGDAAELDEAAQLLRAGLEPCPMAGRPLYAANVQLPTPPEPQLALWHASTLLREHRGDAHVAALTVAGFDPCEAHVTQIAASGASPDSIQPYRGWSDDDWAAAAGRLRDRGWLDDAGRLTEEGRAARRAVEDDTDRLAAEAIAGLLPSQRARLFALLERLIAPLVASGVIPYPNAMGVPRPASR